MNITWIYILLIVIITPLITLYFIKRGKQKGAITTEPNFIHIFPDYPRDHPYNATPGEIINFMVKGYRDEKQIEEIPLIKADISWKHQNYIGNFILKKTAGSITYKLPMTKEKQGKISYVAVYYHGMTDTAWMRISI